MPLQGTVLTGRCGLNSINVIYMLDTKFIDDLARQISDSIPSGLKGMQADVEKNIHTLLQGALGKLDLVTREDFDTQAAVLQRTREKLEQLEQAIAELEKKTTS
jgi:BMFP domain-containing protein YqiC